MITATVSLTSTATVGYYAVITYRDSRGKAVTISQQRATQDEAAAAIERFRATTRMAFMSAYVARVEATRVQEVTS